MLRTKFSFSLKLICSLIICVGGGWLTGLFTNSGLNAWYPKLLKSSLTPSRLTFPIVWAILYILMGISLSLIWSKNVKNKKLALFFFGLQLAFNFTWSFIFFYCKKPNLALIDIVCLWLTLLITIKLFFSISKIAAYLLIPYFLWVSFAIYLNAFIWINN